MTIGIQINAWWFLEVALSLWFDFFAVLEYEERSQHSVTDDSLTAFKNRYRDDATSTEYVSDTVINKMTNSKR